MYINAFATTLNICYFVISNVVNKGLSYDIYASLSFIYHFEYNYII